MRMQPSCIVISTGSFNASTLRVRLFTGGTYKPPKATATAPRGKKGLALSFGFPAPGCQGQGI